MTESSKKKAVIALRPVYTSEVTAESGLFVRITSMSELELPTTLVGTLIKLVTL